jgi:hypothetical protein
MFILAVLDSLPRWIAYWSIGHHLTLQAYVYRIHRIFKKMFATLPYIDPINKASANKYLETVYWGVYTLTASVCVCDPNYTLEVRRNSRAPFNITHNPGLQEKFNSYVFAEEARIRGRAPSHSPSIRHINSVPPRKSRGCKL